MTKIEQLGLLLFRKDANAPEDLGKERWRRIFVSTISAVFSRGFSMLCSIATIPIAAKYLGLSGFGAWSALTSAVTMMAILDFGLGVGFQNRVAELYGKDRLDELGEAFRSALIVIAGTGLFILSICLPIIYWSNLTGMMAGHSSVSQFFTRSTLSLAVILSVVNLVLSIFTRLVVGLQLGWMSSVCNAVAGGLTLAFVITASTLKLGFLPFMACVFAAQSIGQLLIWFLVARHIKTGLRLWGSWSLKEGHLLLSRGAPYILPQLCGAFIYQYPLILLASVGSARAAAIYAVLLKIGGILQQCQQMVLTQIWPAITEALHRGDTAWMRSSINKVVSLSRLGAVICFCGTVALGPILVPFLLHNRSVSVSWLELCLYGAHLGSICLLQAYAYVSNALSVTRSQNYFAIISTGVCLGIFPIVTRTYDLKGLIAGCLILNVAVGIPLLHSTVGKVLSKYSQKGSLVNISAPLKQ